MKPACEQVGRRQRYLHKEAEHKDPMGLLWMMLFCLLLTALSLVLIHQKYGQVSCHMANLYCIGWRLVCGFHFLWSFQIPAWLWHPKGKLEQVRNHIKKGKNSLFPKWLSWYLCVFSPRDLLQTMWLKKRIINYLCSILVHQNLLMNLAKWLMRLHPIFWEVLFLRFIFLSWSWLFCRLSCFHRLF